MGNYLSRRTVARALQPSFEVLCRANNPSVDVAADRVYMAGNVSTPSVSSYLAFPSLPQKRRFISVALSLGSPPAAVSRYPALCCSDFPHAVTCAQLPARLIFSILIHSTGECQLFFCRARIYRTGLAFLFFL